MTFGGHGMTSKVIFVTLAVILPSTLSEYSIDDALLFKVNFNSFSSSKLAEPLQPDGGTPENNAPPKNEPEKKTFDASSFDENAYVETVIMKSTNEEEYKCKIPRIKDSTSGEGDKIYGGPNALELLKQVFVTQSCAYRLEHYWTYELCHGRHIRQYHEERDGTKIKQTEYFLGKYSSESFETDLGYLKEQIEAKTNKKPKKMKIETLNMPFYQLTMQDGTICDLNGQPRITRVNYVCYPAGKNEMYSFKESSTCEYDVIVLSPILCQHPDYRPEESNELGIECTPTDEKSPYKPRNLIQMEADSLRLRSEKMFEGEFMQGDKPGSVRIEIKPVKPNAALDEEELDEAEQNKAENWPEKPAREPFKPIMDPEVVKQFLLGEYCLFGGAGWWKYEFCYGKKVDQYHQEKDGSKTVISLGVFDSKNHIDWMAKNPGKRPKPIDQRKHVSHLYSNGDVCDLTQKPRSVEVKLKCKKSDSPSAVSLYLLEPKTCEYVLGVESPLVCDIIHLADENGFMALKEGDFGIKGPKIHPDEEEVEVEEPESPAVNLPSYQKVKESENTVVKKIALDDAKQDLKDALKVASEMAKEKTSGEEKPLVAKAKKVLGDNVNIDWEDVLYDDIDDDEEEEEEDKSAEKKDEL